MVNDTGILQLVCFSCDPRVAWYNVYVEEDSSTKPTSEFIMSKIWSREEIEAIIRTSDRSVERGIVAIWKRQTASEQRTSDVKELNGRGFSGWTCRNGSYYAAWIMSGRTLSGKHLVKARKICLHHAGQITKISNNEI